MIFKKPKIKVLCNNHRDHNLKESITYNKFLWFYSKQYDYFCVNCDFEKVKKIKISKEFYFNSLNIRELKTQNTQITNKTYKQNYKKEEDPLFVTQEILN